MVWPIGTAFGMMTHIGPPTRLAVKISNQLEKSKDIIFNSLLKTGNKTANINVEKLQFIHTVNGDGSKTAKMIKKAMLTTRSIPRLGYFYAVCVCVFRFFEWLCIWCVFYFLLCLERIIKMMTMMMTNIDIQAMLVCLTLPFYDFCGFRSVAVNSV